MDNITITIDMQEFARLMGERSAASMAEHGAEAVRRAFASSMDSYNGKSDLQKAIAAVTVDTLASIIGDTMKEPATIEAIRAVAREAVIEAVRDKVRNVVRQAPRPDVSALAATLFSEKE